MKKLTILALSLLLMSQAMAQTKVTDLEIAKTILCKEYSEVTESLKSIGVDGYLDGDELTVINGSTIIKHKLGYDWVIGGDKIVIQDYARYYRKDAEHMKSFVSYNLPENDKVYKYERKMGNKYGHLKVTAKCKKK